MPRFFSSLIQWIKTRFIAALRHPRVLWRADSAELQVTVEVKQWLPWLITLALLLYMLASPEPVVVMAFVAMLGAVAAEYWWARSLAKQVRGQRRLRFTAMQVGDEMEEEISLRNTHPLVPVLWVEFNDRSTIPGYTLTSVRGAGADSVTDWRARTICSRRGVFSLGPWELRMGSPMGFFGVRQVYRQKQEMLVYPPMAALPEHILPHRGALGDNRPLNQPLRAETIASTTVRSYTPGDPLHHIHWRTTARRAEPFVKVFAPEASSNIWLVPDFEAASHREQGEHSTLETMVTVTASLAAALLQQRLSVGLFASAKNSAFEPSADETGEQEKVVLPRMGQPHLWTILQALAPLQASPTPLQTALTRARMLISGNDLIIVITSSLSPEWSSMLHGLARSRGGAGRAEVILIDPASFVADPDLQGKAERMVTFLMRYGIPASVLGREEVRLISGYYGEVSRWEFKVMGTGRAILTKTPRAAGTIASSGKIALPGGNGEAAR